MIVDHNIYYKTIKLHIIEQRYDDYYVFINKVNKFCESINAINVQIIQEEMPFNNGIEYKAIISETIYSTQILHVNQWD